MSAVDRSAFLSAFRVLAEFGKSLQNSATESQARLYGQLVAHLVVLRRMSISIASLLEEGLMPDTEAALIKDLGNSYERLVPEVVRLYLPGQVPKGLAQALEECVLHAPSFTLRGRDPGNFTRHDRPWFGLKVIR